MKRNEVTIMINSNDDNIRHVLEELSCEIPFEYDMTTDTMYFSDKYKQVYDRKPKISHFVKNACKNYLTYAKNVARLEEFRRILDYGDMTRYIQLQWPDKNGKYEWCEIVYRHVIDSLGNVKAVGIWRNIDRQKREQVLIKHQIATESVEGVHNKTAIEEVLTKEFRHIGLGNRGALYLIDLDNTKIIQSAYGLVAAEDLLQLFSKELLVHFHEEGMVGYLGSDKFLLYVRQVEDRDMAKVLAKRVQSILWNLSEQLNLNKVITASIGVTEIEKTIPYKDALTEADTALRHAKNTGKNKFVFYSKNLESERYRIRHNNEQKDKNKKKYDIGRIWADFLEKLYKSENEKKGINLAIEFLGHVFELDKIMVWEYSIDQESISNTCQWVRDGIKNTMEEAQNLPSWQKEEDFVYNADGFYYCSDVTKMSEAVQNHASGEKFTAFLQAGMQKDDEKLGFIVFGMCSGPRMWGQEEIDFLVFMSRLLGDSLRKRRTALQMEAYYANTRNLINSVISGIYVVDQSTYELYYYNNTAAKELQGNRCGKTCYERFYNRDKVCEHCVLPQLKEEPEKSTASRIFCSNRSKMVIETTATKTVWENKNAYIITMNEHLATKEEREMKRQQEFLEKRYAFIYSHSCDCIFDINITEDHYEMTIINKELDWSQIPKSGVYTNLIRNVLEEYILPEDRERVISKFSRRCLQESATNKENMITDSFYIYTSKGTIQCKEVRAFLLEEDGKQMVVATYCDVTEQKRKETQELVERQKLTRAVISVYPLLLSVNITENTYVVLAQDNLVFRTHLEGEIFSNSILDTALYIHPEDRDSFMQSFDRENLRQQFSGDKNEITMELRQMGQDGNYHWLSLVVIRIDNPLNEDLLLYIFGRDIDKSKEMEQNLKEALATAEKASAAKSDFLSRMSHEIRTPMNAIIGMNEIAKTVTNKPGSVKSYLNKIDTSAHYLLSLINNILDMSRIESNKVEIEKKEFYLQDILNNIQNIIGPQAKAKKIYFTIEKKSNFESAYIGDRLRLNQVLLNLLSNAIKFTDKGGTVSLSVKESRRGDGESYFCFTVSDTGAGMSEEFMKNMYNPFEQENATSAQGIAGTGLGLSITKNLVNLMGGHMKAKSKKGEGTTFIVEIKMNFVDKPSDMWITCEKCEQNVDKTISLKGKRVLLVEDNELNQEIAITLLEMSEMKVDCVENGELAVQKFLEMGNFYYDVVLMDIRMPVKNGLEATADIRAIGGKYATEVPIIAMSANAFSEDKAKAFANGMTDYLVKPIDIDIVRDMLVKYLL